MLNRWRYFLAQKAKAYFCIKDDAYPKSGKKTAAAPEKGNRHIVLTKNTLN